MELEKIGVTEKKAKQFAKKGIYDTDDLARYIPIRYNDFSTETSILPPESTSCLLLRVERVRQYYNGTSLIIAYCHHPWTGGSVSVMWYNQPWLYNSINERSGKTIFVAGKAVYNESYNNYTISSPEAYDLHPEEGRPRIYPVYSKIPGMSDDYLISKVRAAFEDKQTAHEIWPRDIVVEYGLLNLRKALKKLHFPKRMGDVEKGRRRLAFDDLLRFALCSAWAERSASEESPYIVKSLDVYERITWNLPYVLTDDQKGIISEMLQSAQKGKRINALLQGDVGCGKSIVAFILMAVMADNGCQSAIMAPTQVLANQHYADLSALMEPLGFSVALLDSGMKKKERTEILEKIKSGDVDMVVGTHAVMGKDVEYNRLALTIADEEHRFGVEQRAALVNKAKEGVHSITMSATPIPRSLAQVVYGEAIQLYTIQTMPEGRLPVMTQATRDRDKIYKFVLKQAQQGFQTYVVCPMIDKNDDIEGVKSVEEVAEEYHDALDKYGVRIETLTGRNSKTETEDIINRFRNGEVHVLIATTVIEVGVNVPTATTMVISNAERFGLSSLHQLRGRVGRGQRQSYCILECGKATPDAKQRLAAMCRTTNGFEIAEEDLKIRGVGEFFGTRQSGENRIMPLMMAYPAEYEKAKEVARKLLDRNDGNPIVQGVMHGECEVDESVAV